jgi:hypothetical protein
MEPIPAALPTPARRSVPSRCGQTLGLMRQPLQPRLPLLLMRALGIEGGMASKPAPQA